MSVSKYWVFIDDTVEEYGDFDDYNDDVFGVEYDQSELRTVLAGFKPELLQKLIIIEGKRITPRVEVKFFDS